MDVSLISPIVSRNGLPLSDSYILNGYVQSNKKVSKRPGLSLSYQFSAGTGQGMFSMSGVDYAIIGDVIYNIASPYTSYAIPSVTTANLQYQFISNPPYLSSALTVLKSTAGMWTFNGTSITKVTDSNYPVTTTIGIAFLDGTYYVQTPQGLVYGSALADPTTWPSLRVLTVNTLEGQSIAIASNNVQVACFGTQWLTQYYDAGNAAPGTPLSQNFSGSHSIGCASASSIVQMDEFIVFMAQTEHGRSIRILSNSEIAPISNDEINRILDNDNLSLVYAFPLDISGKLFYLLSLGASGITLVYDFTSKLWTYWASGVSGAASPVQLTLSTDGVTVTGVLTNNGFQQGDIIKISGATLAAFNGSFSVSIIDSNTFTYQLNYNSFVIDQYNNFLVDQNGNFLVANTIPSSGGVQGATTVSRYSTTYLSVMASTGANYVLSTTTGAVYQLSTTAYVDANGLIDFQIVTPETMGQDSALKRIGAIEIRGDKVATTGYIRYSDDGYNTWSTYQPVNMLQSRSQTIRCGSTRRRAFQFRNVDNTPLRVQDLVVSVDWTEGGV